MKKKKKRPHELCHGHGLPFTKTLQMGEKNSLCGWMRTPDLTPASQNATGVTGWEQELHISALFQCQNRQDL